MTDATPPPDLPSSGLPSDEISSDGLLLRRYRDSGDEAAFAELRRRHGRLVLATCRRETGDPGLAEDAAQEAFLLLSRKEFPADASLAGWLHGAARLVSRNLLRGEARRLQRERRAHEEFAEPVAAWNAVSPHIDAALAALRARDREVVLLRFANEMTLGEIGNVLGIGENAARMSVARALERMRVSLRRAGLGVPVVLLATLLSTRIADAEPLPPLPPASPLPHPTSSPLVSSSAQLALSSGLLKILAGAMLVLAGGVAVRSLLPRPPARIVAEPLLPAAEGTALLDAAAGEWRGDLEYADDRTAERSRTGTTVDVRRTEGGLTLTARYASYTSVDTTVITPDGRGRFTIRSRGSHNLDGIYELVRLPDGSTAFAGLSPALRTAVRLRIQATADTLAVQEEFLRGGTYRFRNRFNLRRSWATPP